MSGIKKNNILFLLLLIVIAVFIVYLIGNESLAELGIKDYSYEKVFEDENISIISLNSSVDALNLKVDQSAIDHFSFSFIPKATMDGTLPSIGVGTAYMSYNIVSRNKLLYSYGEEERHVVKSGATDLNILRIPSECIGHRISVNFQYRVIKANKIPATVYVGEKKNIVKQIFNQEWMELAFALFTFVIGCVMLVLGLISFLFKLKSNRYIVVGLFTMFLSLYIFMQTQSVYSFIKNPILAYFILYIGASAYVSCLAFLLYKQIRGKRSFIGRIIYEILVLNITVQTILTISGVSEYIYFREFSFLLVFVVSALMIYVLLINRDPDYPLKNETKPDKIIILSTLIMLIGLIIGSVMYNISITSNYILTVYVSLTIYIVTQLFVSLETYTRDYKKALKLNYFKEVALYDNLTKVGSRYAFDSFVVQFQSNTKKYNSISIVVIDVNNLKFINDNFGHDSGDKIIEAIGIVLRCLEVQCSEFKTKAYRLGGDEFMVVAFNTDRQSHLHLEGCLQSCYRNYLSENRKSLLEFSQGAVYNEIDENFDFEKAVKIADQKMYDDKKIKKAKEQRALQFAYQREMENEEIH